MTRSFLFIAAILFSFNGLSQKVHVNVHYLNKKNQAKNDTIYYNSDQKLTWSDFQGAPDLHHFGGAVTASGFAYNADMEYDRNNITIDIYVFTFFTKHDSWKKPHINSAYHLEHEQHHFDITYLGALRFVQQLKKATFTADNFKTLPEQIFNKAYDDNEALQAEYDRETKNSIDVEAQQVWNQKITEMLASMTASNDDEQFH